MTTRKQRLPQVIKQQLEGDKADYLLFVASDACAFDGHFPNHPVLPGLIQLEWADHFSQSLAPEASLKNIEKLKFSRLLLPDCNVQLQLQRISVKDETIKIQFRLFDDEGNYSSGNLNYQR